MIGEGLSSWRGTIHHNRNWGCYTLSRWLRRLTFDLLITCFHFYSWLRLLDKNWFNTHCCRLKVEGEKYLLDTKQNLNDWLTCLQKQYEDNTWDGALFPPATITSWLEPSLTTAAPLGPCTFGRVVWFCVITCCKKNNLKKFRVVFFF